MFDRKMLVDGRVSEFRARRDAFISGPNAVHPRADMDFDVWFNGPAANKRYVSQFGTSTGDGLTEGTAWDPATWVEKQKPSSGYSWPTSCWTVFIDHFWQANLEVTADNQLLDLRRATLTSCGQILPGDIDPASGGTNEYKIKSSKVAGNNANICLLESRQRMSGWTAQWSGGAMKVVNIDGGNKRIQVDVTFELRVGQKVCLIRGPITGIPANVDLYIVDATTPTSGSTRRQWIKLSTTSGGSPLSPSGATPNDGAFWSLYGGDGGLPAGEMRIPQRGSLLPGEFAYAPGDAGGPTIYFRPAGSFSTSTFELCQQTTASVITILGGNCQVLGGEVYGATGALARGRGSACVGSGLWGTRLYAGGRGALATNLDESGAFKAAKGWQAWYCEVNDVADHAFGAYGLSDDDGKTDMRVGWCHAHDNARLETDYVDAQGVVTNPRSDRLRALHVVLERIGRDPAYKAPPNFSMNLGGLVIDESSDCLFFDCLLSDVYGEQVECGSGAAAAPARNLVINCSFLLPAMPAPRASISPVQAVWRSHLEGTAGFKPIDRSNTMSHCVVVLGDNMTQRSNSLDSGVVTLRSENTVACELTFAHNWVFGGAGANSSLYVLRQTLGSAGPLPRVWADGNLFVCPEVQYIGATVLNSTGTWTPATTWTPAQWANWQAAIRVDQASVLAVVTGTRPEEAILHLLPPDGRRLDGMRAAPGLVP